MKFGSSTITIFIILSRNALIGSELTLKVGKFNLKVLLSTSITAERILTNWLPELATIKVPMYLLHIV